LARLESSNFADSTFLAMWHAFLCGVSLHSTAGAWAGACSALPFWILGWLFLVLVAIGEPHERMVDRGEKVDPEHRAYTLGL